MAWVYVGYIPWNMLNITQQNLLKYGFSGIYVLVKLHHKYRISLILQEIEAEC